MEAYGENSHDERGLTDWCLDFHPHAPEEVGQPIRRTSRPIRLRHFPHARTKLLVSKIYIGLINIDFFHIVMQIFWKISRDTTFTTVNLPIGTVS